MSLRKENSSADHLASGSFGGVTNNVNGFFWFVGELEVI